MNTLLSALHTFIHYLLPTSSPRPSMHGPLPPPLNKGSKGERENTKIITLKGNHVIFSPLPWGDVSRRKTAWAGAFVAHTWGWHYRLPQGVGGGVWGGDTLRTYYTEDTPASISHAASISDLSTLSIPGEEPRKERHASGQRPSLNDSGDNSSDNDNLLEQCIQSAMPKVRRLFLLFLLFLFSITVNNDTLFTLTWRTDFFPTSYLYMLLHGLVG